MRFILGFIIAFSVTSIAQAVESSSASDKAPKFTSSNSSPLFQSMLAGHKTFKDAGLSFAFDLSNNMNLYNLDNARKSRGWTYDFSLSKKFLENYTANVRLFVDQDQRELDVKEQVKIRSYGVFGSGGLTVGFSRKAFEIGEFKLAPSVRFPIPVGREMSDRQGLQFGIIPGLSLRAPSSWLTDKVSLGYSFRAFFADHRYTVTTKGAANLPYKIVHGISLGYKPFKKLGVNFSANHAPSWNYNNNIRALYLFSTSIDYTVNDMFSIYANFISAGDVVAPDGNSFDVELYGQKGSTLYLGATLSI